MSADPPVEQNDPPYINPDNTEWDKAPGDSSTTDVTESIPYFVEDFLQTLIDVHWRKGTTPTPPIPCQSYIQSYLPAAGYSKHTPFAPLDWGLDTTNKDGKYILNFTTWKVGSVTHYGWNSWTLANGVLRGTYDIGLFFGQGGSDQNGTLISGSGSSNFCPVNAIDESVPTLTWTYGVNSGFGPPGSPGMVNATNGIYVLHANASWILSTTLSWITLNDGQTGHFIAGGLSSGPPWSITDGTQNFLSGQVLTDPDPSDPTKFNCATAYIISHTAGPPPAYLGFYALSVVDGGPGATTTAPLFSCHHLGRILPGDVDPDWAGMHFFQSSGNYGDNTPENLGCIATASLDFTTTSVAAWAHGTTYAKGAKISYAATVYISLEDGNQGNIPPNTLGTWWRKVQMQYIVKFDTGGADYFTPGYVKVKWKVPILKMIFPDTESTQSRIYNGLLAVFANVNAPFQPTVVYLINTKTGKYITQEVSGISVATVGQAWDDVSNSVVSYGSYSSTVPGAPLGKNGTKTFNSQWFRYWMCPDLLP